MKTAQLQSIKSNHAAEITELIKQQGNKKAQARVYFEIAYQSLKAARKAAYKIQRLAEQQVAIKADLRGPGKAPRAKKPDRRQDRWQLVDQPERRIKPFQYEQVGEVGIDADLIRQFEAVRVADMVEEG